MQHLVWPRRILTLVLMPAIFCFCMWIWGKPLTWISWYGYMYNTGRVSHEFDNLYRNIRWASDDVYSHERRFYSVNSALSGGTWPSIGFLSRLKVFSLGTGVSMRYDIASPALGTVSMKIDLLYERDCSAVVNTLLYNYVYYWPHPTGAVVPNVFFERSGPKYQFITGVQVPELSALAVNGRSVDLSGDVDRQKYSLCDDEIAERQKRRAAGGDLLPIQISAQFTALDEVPARIKRKWAEEERLRSMRHGAPQQ